MSEQNINSKTGLTSQLQPEAQVIPGFSAQATGLAETTFAETIGLAMHNAVLSQQNSQMMTQASVTNACARLLKVPSLNAPNPIAANFASATHPTGGNSTGTRDENVIEPESVTVNPDKQISQAEPKKSGGLSLSNLFGRKKNNQDGSSNGNIAQKPTNNEGNEPETPNLKI